MGIGGEGAVQRTHFDLRNKMDALVKKTECGARGGGGLVVETACACQTLYDPFLSEKQSQNLAFLIFSQFS